MYHGYRRYRARQYTPRRASSALGRVMDKLGGSEQFRFVRVWRAWPEILGAEIAAMARPLGRHKRTLVLGAVDSMVMQHLSYFSPEILDKVNAYLGEDFFDKVRFELLYDRPPLDGIPGREAHPPKGARPPKGLGSLKELDKDQTAVGRSYRAYVRHVAGLTPDGKEES